MKEIPLTKGKVALVDGVDYPRVAAFRWYAVETKNTFYAARLGGKGQSRVYMHRFIVGAPEEQEPDHRDGNGLNNQRYNLLLGTHSDNMITRRTKSTPKSSRFRGVVFDKSTGLWKAKTTYLGKTYNLGRFSDEEAAARVFDAWAKETYGERAVLNFPNQIERLERQLAIAQDQNAQLRGIVDYLRSKCQSE